MSHSKKAARLSILTLSAALLLATPALAAPRPRAEAPAAGSSLGAVKAWIATFGPVAGELLLRAVGQVAQPPRPTLPAHELLALEPIDRELGRGPYIDPNGVH